MITNSTNFETNKLQDLQGKLNNSVNKEQQNTEQNVDVAKVIEESAVEVSLSMGAQIVLAMMESMQTLKDNASGQKAVLDFLSGKEVSDDFNLANTGYEGKPITELSQDEATALVEGDGFFSVTSTSDRVAGFALSLAGDDIEKIEQVREGLIQGFKEAEEMWGGKLPEISYETQARTLELVDAKLAELKNVDKPEEVENKEISSLDITV